MHEFESFSELFPFSGLRYVCVYLVIFAIYVYIRINGVLFDNGPIFDNFSLLFDQFTRAPYAQNRIVILYVAKKNDGVFINLILCK